MDIDWSKFHGITIFLIGFKTKNNKKNHKIILYYHHKWDEGIKIIYMGNMTEHTQTNNHLIEEALLRNIPGWVINLRLVI